MPGEQWKSPAGGAAGSGSYRPGYEMVAEQLLAYVAEREMRPGDRLPTEVQLAEVMDTSRHVMREAVKVLAAIGRLKVRRGAGIFVAEAAGQFGSELLAHYQPTSMEDVLMMLDYRRLVETESARKAGQLATPGEVRAIRESADASLRAGNGPDIDIEAFASADTRFHDAVGTAAHNIFLRDGAANVRTLAAQSDVLLFHGDAPGSLEVAGRQHIAIAEAIAQGEPELAAERMQEHVDTTRRQFERKIRDRLFDFTEPRPVSPRDDGRRSRDGDSSRSAPDASAS
ncbi:FadR/GntR family transcriptional regulator [Streptomyces sp. NPDC054765]